MRKKKRRKRWRRRKKKKTKRTGGGHLSYAPEEREENRRGGTGLHVEIVLLCPATTCDPLVNPPSFQDPFLPFFFLPSSCPSFLLASFLTRCFLLLSPSHPSSPSSSSFSCSTLLRPLSILILLPLGCVLKSRSPTSFLCSSTSIPEDVIDLFHV